MLRSRLRNKFLKANAEESEQLYHKQQNLRVTLLRRGKRNYFGDLDNGILNDKRKFWKKGNSMYSEKAYQKEYITIISKNTEETITKNEELAETLILSSLVWLIFEANVSANSNPAMRAIETFKYHPSILKIREFMTDKDVPFSFSYTTQEKTYKTMQNLVKKKTFHESDISVRITKSLNDIFSYFIYHNFNNLPFRAIFPSELKKADIIHIHKKESKFDISSLSRSVKCNMGKILRVSHILQLISLVFRRVK